VNPIDRLLAFLWDRSGHRREAQAARLAQTHAKIRKLEAVRLRATRQIVTTQSFVSKHKGGR